MEVRRPSSLCRRGKRADPARPSSLSSLFPLWKCVYVCSSQLLTDVTSQQQRTRDTGSVGDEKEQQRSLQDDRIGDQISGAVTQVRDSHFFGGEYAMSVSPLFCTVHRHRTQSTFRSRSACGRMVTLFSLSCLRKGNCPLSHSPLSHVFAKRFFRLRSLTRRGRFVFHVASVRRENMTAGLYPQSAVLCPIIQTQEQRTADLHAGLQPPCDPVGAEAVGDFSFLIPSKFLAAVSNISLTDPCSPAGRTHTHTQAGDVKVRHLSFRMRCLSFPLFHSRTKSARPVLCTNYCSAILVLYPTSKNHCSL